MSRHFLDPPLKPRDDKVLRVIGIARISRETQDEKSLGDQESLLRQWVTDHYDGLVEWHIIAGQGSGEQVDRQEVTDAEDLVTTNRYDLVIMEDLGRHERRVQAFSFCELCEDSQTRLIAINDNIDTLHDWHMNAIFTSMRHEMYNADTSRRIKRTLRNRFTQGGIIARPIFGYILRPVKNPTEANLQKDPAAESIYDEWFRRLENGETFSNIADWLNDNHIPVGRYCRNPKWNCQMVGQVTRNPILKGLRVRNKRVSKRINSSGKRKSVKAPPEDLLERECPHLAFIDPTRYDRVRRLLHERNEKYTRGRKRALDSRNGVPRKRTIWPGQSMHCGVCGCVLYYGAHGRNDHLICSGARDYTCWNSVSISGPMVAKRIGAAVWNHIQQLPDLDEIFLNELRSQFDRRNSSFDADRQALDQKMVSLERAHENIMAAIRVGGQMASLLAELRDIEQEIDEVKLQRERLNRSVRRTPTLPSVDEIRNKAAEIFPKMPQDTPEFGRWMNRLIPRLEVFPVRACDGGHSVLRAEFTLYLPALLAASSDWAGVPSEVLSPNLTVDLFDPAQRVANLAQVVEMAANSTLRERDIGAALGIAQATVQRAKKLWQRMQQEGRTDPYVRLLEPPKDETKRRRHLHSRYHFEPLPTHRSV
ncbi:MAG: recombinase family protein [Thermoguttaceae bacterium]